MAKVLELVFKNSKGTKKTISIANPKEDITAEVATKAMGAVITADVFVCSGEANLVEAVEARYKDTDITVLA